jgi:antitoxin FitA
MATLTIRNVDEAHVERLRQRAVRNNRSLEAELRQLIAETVERPTTEELLALVDKIAAMTPDVPQTDSVELLRQTREER